MKWLWICIFIPLLPGCELADQHKELEKAKQQLEQTSEKVKEKISEGSRELSEQANEAKESLQELSNVSIIDSGRLLAMLPESLPGMERTHTENQQNTRLGVHISQAEAGYSDGDKASLNIHIIDLGSLQAVTAILKLPWLNKEINNKTDHGFERTRDIRGHRGYEKYQSRNRTGEMRILIHERVVLSVSGENIGHRELDRALGRVDLRKLEQLVD
ncbi:hypothetical protein GF406_03245 [candidate division KSB1 bacterium]|nr:hypothetical protein [candidate division KSB1 bacterium]